MPDAPLTGLPPSDRPSVRRPQDRSAECGRRNAPGRSSASQAERAARRRPSSIRAIPRRSSAIEATLMKARSSSRSVQPCQHLRLRRWPPAPSDSTLVSMRMFIDRGRAAGHGGARDRGRRRARAMKRAETPRGCPCARSCARHSSAETTTALGLLRAEVMICGSVWARSITSDSLALASATVQLSEIGGDDVLAAVITPLLTILTNMTIDDGRLFLNRINHPIFGEGGGCHPYGRPANRRPF